MQKDFENFFYNAEDHYLTSEEMTAFNNKVSQLKQRLAIYKEIRNQEITIFQGIADSLVKAFPTERSQRLEKALKHWMLVMRYGAMAMLLNNPDYLRHRLLEWLTEMIQTQETMAIETYICDSLISKLEAMFSFGEMELLNPFLVEAKTMLLDPKNTAEPVSIGE